jgi:hydroxypyruvate isomerase
MNKSHLPPLRRRSFLATLGGATAFSFLAAVPRPSEAEPRKGRIKQCVCLGVFRGLNLDLDGQCREAARLGAWGVDLVGPNDFPILKKHGLIPTMVPGGAGIKSGINDKKNHADLDRKMREAIKASAQAGAPNVIVMAGDRQGISDEEGLDNCALFLNNLKAYAEDQQVTLCTELLNSKVNHPGYMCDHTQWGVELCKRVNSPRVKLLYDIYHMQIMEGDVIRTIRENIQYIGHFHTGGVPGRHELDETQELNWRTIAQAIADLKFEGYFAHEFVPVRDPIASLKAAFALCTV